MADLTQTVADVHPYTGYRTLAATFGGPVTAGNPVYRDTTSGKYLRADSSSAAKALVAGIAITNGDDGIPGHVQTSGSVDLGATLVKGESYYVSSVAGAIQPSADVGAAEYVSLLGIATAADTLLLGIVVSGIDHA
jgi:hypothetical protein